MTLRSEGRFEADGFERVIMIRIYEEEDGFHIHAKPWFQLTDDPRAAEAFGPITWRASENSDDSKEPRQARCRRQRQRILQGILLRQSGMG